MQSHKSPKFIYFSTLDFDSVFKTQVIGWVDLYRDHGLDFAIVKVAPIKYVFKRKKRKAEKRGIRKLYNGELTFLYTFPERIWLGQMLNVVLMMSILLKSGIGRRNVTMQIRSAAFHRSLNKVKKIIGRRFRVIYDSRAAAAEEFLYNNNNIDFPAIKDKYEAIKRDDHEMVRISNRVFCVSNELIRYHEQLTDQSINNGKFFLYPCSADQRFFYFDEQLRENMRNQLGIKDKFVIVYSGGLEMKWHVPDLLFNFFRQVDSSLPNAFFMVLTNDIELGQRHFERFGISEKNYLVRSADNREVHKYLNAADLGTLLRENHMMNKVASPTKFAEYLMCGLSVVITPGVGDFSALVQEYSWGFIYSNGSLDPSRLEQLQSRVGNELRRKISRYGRAHFSKQSRLNEILEVYSQLS